MSEMKQNIDYFNDADGIEVTRHLIPRRRVGFWNPPLADAYPVIDKISGRVLKHRRFILDNKDLL